MTLITAAEPIGMRQRSSGVTVVTRAETRDRDGELVVEQYMTTFVRGAQGGAGHRRGGPAAQFDEALREREPAAEVVQTFDADQTFRYAQASGDPMPIHLDEEFAKAVGPARDHHPRAVHDGVHVVGGADRGGRQTQPAKRLAVRFAKMVLPERRHRDPLLVGRLADDATSYAYETAVGDDLVINDGLADIADN